MELTIARRSLDGNWSDELPDWDGPSTMVTMYGPASMLDNPAPIEEIGRLYPNSVVVGCSGAGVLVDDEMSDGDLIVTVSRFQNIHLAAAFGTVSESRDQTEVGKEIQKKLLAQDSQTSGILLFSSGKITDGDSVSEGFEQINGAHVVRVGGGLAGTLPGDDGTFGSTWVLDENRRPVDGAMSAVGFSGADLIFRNAAKGGWKPLGPERIVTGAEGQILREIDGRPALELYKEYLGEQADELPAIALQFPLSSRPKSGASDDWAPAGVIGVDEDSNSLQLTRKIVEGSPLQMLRGYSGELFDAAEEAAVDLKPETDDTHLAIVTSCLGRRIVLGSRTADELSFVRQAFPENVGMAGFYGMGEFSSTSTTACKLYNFTMTLALIGERCRD